MLYFTTPDELAAIEAQVQAELADLNAIADEAEDAINKQIAAEADANCSPQWDSYEWFIGDTTPDDDGWNEF